MLLSERSWDWCKRCQVNSVLDFHQLHRAHHRPISVIRITLMYRTTRYQQCPALQPTVKFIITIISIMMILWMPWVQIWRSQRAKFSTVLPITNAQLYWTCLAATRASDNEMPQESCKSKSFSHLLFTSNRVDVHYNLPIYFCWYTENCRSIDFLFLLIKSFNPNVNSNLFV